MTSFLENLCDIPGQARQVLQATGGKKRKVRVVNFLGVLPGVMIWKEASKFFFLWADLTVGRKEAATGVWRQLDTSPY